MTLLEFKKHLFADPIFEKIFASNSRMQFVALSFWGGIGSLFFYIVVFQHNIFVSILFGIFGAIYLTVFAITLPSVISKQRERSRQKKQMEITQTVRKILDSERPNIDYKQVLTDFLQQFIETIEDIPNDEPKQKYEAFNEVWKDRIRHAENNNMSREEIMEIVRYCVKIEVNKLKETDQLINDKVHTQNNSENIESVKKSNKIKFLDE